MDKRMILNKIREYLNLKSDAEFAAYLGVAPTTISSWKSRNTFDIELIYAKCSELNPEWLLTGEGPMLKSPNTFQEKGETYITGRSKDELYEMLLIEKEERIRDLQKYIEDMKEQLAALDKKTTSTSKVVRHTP